MKLLSSSALALIGLLLLGEGVARWVIGLGNPPLSVAHPTIEYMFAPNQDLSRFHNRQLYNEYGMRSPSLDALGERRLILVMGDSIVNGGALTDHAALATTLLTSEREFYANISAGSWGPANISAYIDEFGLFEADAAILVLNSNDIHDLPSFAPLDPLKHPMVKPPSALWELVTRYAAPKIQQAFASVGTRSHATGRANQDGPAAFQALLSQFESAGLPICVVLHQSRNELMTTPSQSYQTSLEAVKGRGLPIQELATLLKSAIAEGSDVYRDDVHLTDGGQAALARALKACAQNPQVPGEAS